MKKITNSLLNIWLIFSIVFTLSISVIGKSTINSNEFNKKSDIIFSQNYIKVSTNSEINYTIFASTYIGGINKSASWDSARDSLGNIYLTGFTNSEDFPTTEGAYNRTYNGGDNDIFVCKISADGTTLIYSTFIGGTGSDTAIAIAVDSDGCAYITGETNSEVFPTTEGALNRTHSGGGNDVFVCKLSADGATLLYSTYIGGDGDDTGFSITIDNTGSAYITGQTTSSNFTVTENALDKTNDGGRDIFACKLSPDGSSLNYSTYIGGSFSDLGVECIIDSAGFQYITGYTMSSDFPTTEGAYNRTFAPGDFTNSFALKLDTTGTSLIYSTYLGGWDDSDYGFDLALNPENQLYIAGRSASPYFPTTEGAYNRTYSGGDSDAVICKLSADGSSLLNSTYLGGSQSDEIQSITLDSENNIYVTGVTHSTDFPMTETALDDSFGGAVSDGFFCILSSDLGYLNYSTYIGGNGNDGCTSIHIDSSRSIYLAGASESTDLNTTEGAINQTNNGGMDAFFMKLDLFEDTEDPIPSVVLGLTELSKNQSSISISWNANPEPDINYYNIYRDDFYITSTTNTTLKDNNLTPNTMYKYQISAVDNADQEGPLSDPLFVVTDPVPPSQVSGLIIEDVTNTSITLIWNTNPEPDISHYRIYRNGTNIFNTTETTFIDQNLTPNTTYEYQISAVNTADQEGPLSTAKYITTTTSEDENISFGFYFIVTSIFGAIYLIIKSKRRTK